MLDDSEEADTIEEPSQGAHGVQPAGKPGAGRGVLPALNGPGASVSWRDKVGLGGGSKRDVVVLNIVA